MSPTAHNNGGAQPAAPASAAPAAKPAAKPKLAIFGANAKVGARGMVR